MTLKISCALAPSVDTPEHVTLAEQLGYERAWVYDSPALYHDVFMTLAQPAGPDIPRELESFHRAVQGL